MKTDPKQHKNTNVCHDTYRAHLSVLTIQTCICFDIYYNYSKNNIKLMLWENGNIKINLSGKSKSEKSAPVKIRIYR